MAAPLVASVTHVVADNDTTLRVRFTDEDGNASDADGDVEVEVVDGDGNSIHSDTLSSNAGSKGVYETVLPAQSTLDELTVTWTATVDTLAREINYPAFVIGSRLVSFSTLRTDPEIGSLGHDALAAALTAAESWFRDALEFPPFAIGERLGFELPSPTPRLLVPGVLYPRKVNDVKLNGDAFDASDLAEVTARRGAFERVTSTGTRRLWQAGWYDLHVEHGWDAPTADLTRAARIFVRYLARQVAYPERAREVVTDGAVISFSMPSADRPTGIPEVDGVVNRYGVDLVTGWAL